jgi:hypothetical protein
MILTTFKKSNGEKIAFPQDRLLCIEQKGPLVVLTFENKQVIEMPIDFDEAVKQFLQQPKVVS